MCIRDREISEPQHGVGDECSPVGPGSPMSAVRAEQQFKSGVAKVLLQRFFKSERRMLRQPARVLAANVIEQAVKIGIAREREEPVEGRNLVGKLGLQLGEI